MVKYIILLCMLDTNWLCICMMHIILKILCVHAGTILMIPCIQPSSKYIATTVVHEKFTLWIVHGKNSCHKILSS